MTMAAVSPATGHGSVDAGGNLRSAGSASQLADSHAGGPATGRPSRAVHRARLLWPPLSTPAPVPMQPRNLTEGPIARTLFVFALPILGGNVLQSLNGSVNAIWVGRFLGEEALGAIANANNIMFLLLGGVFGFGGFGRGDGEDAGALWYVSGTHARAINDRLFPLHYAMFSDASPAPTKYALARMHGCDLGSEGVAVGPAPLIWHLRPRPARSADPRSRS